MNKCEKLLALTKVPVIITSDENVFYYSSFSGGDSFLFISEKRRILYTDTRYTYQAKLEAPDFELVDENVFDHFEKMLKEEGIDTFGVEEDKVTLKLASRLMKLGKIVPMAEKVNSLRKIKSEDEIIKISNAQKLSESAFLHFLENAKVGMTEAEVALMLENYMRKNGAASTSFETIVARGERGAMPHARAGQSVIKSGDLVVIDFGAKLEGYSADMTRTVIFGNCTDYEKDTYLLVKKANEEACRAAKEGMRAGELDAVARNIIEAAGFKKEFNHSLGHGVGINVHEPPYARRGSDEVLKENMTLTIEPGIYIPDKFGVRIEDLIIIKKEGNINLNTITKEPIYI